MEQASEIKKQQQSFDFNTEYLLQKTKQINCIKQRPAKLACLNKNCQKYAFICNQSDCPCFQQHQKCLHISTKTISRVILDKVIQINPLKQLIDQRINKIIDQLSEYRDKQISKLNQNFILFGLSQTQIKFIKAIQNGSVKQIHGKDMWDIHLNLYKQQQILKILHETQKSIQSQFKQLQQSIQIFCIQSQQSVQKLKIQSKHFLSNRNSKKFQSSKIIKTNEEQVKIQMFFDKLNIKKAELLYRASQNQFNVEKFHQKCDNINHTLTVCETQYGKVIGGYTPISWQTLENWTYVKDETACSFIFSLSNNDKLVLNQPSRAIIHRNDFTYGPQFGGGADLIIADKANRNSNSFSRINTSYCNKHYQYCQKQSYKRFSGSQSQFFRIKQWEVWRLQFEDQNN